MGRRAKRAEPEIYLRQRIESIPAPNGSRTIYQDHNGKIRAKRAKATQEWGEMVFKPKYGRYPSKIEVCQAIDSGEIGNWIANQHERTIVDSVIVIGDREIPKAKYIAKGKELAKGNSSFREEMAQMRQERREKRWRQESITETVEAVVAGKLDPKDTKAMEAYSDKLFADKANWYACDQILAKASKRK